MFNWKKSLFVSILSVVIIFASFFMITESARYYRHFYEVGAWQPLYLAALLELFVLSLAVIRIGKSKMFLLVQKLIMVGVFCSIIFAAGMQAVNPTLESLAQVTKQEQLGGILQKEYDSLIEDRAVFDKQMFYILAAKNSSDLVAEIIGLLGSELSAEKGSGSKKSGS